jgi:hypothetical protein
MSVDLDNEFVEQGKWNWRNEQFIESSLARTAVSQQHNGACSYFVSMRRSLENCPEALVVG